MHNEILNKTLCFSIQNIINSKENLYLWSMKYQYIKGILTNKNYTQQLGCLTFGEDNSRGLKVREYNIGKYR